MPNDLDSKSAQERAATAFILKLHDKDNNGVMSLPEVREFVKTLARNQVTVQNAPGYNAQACPTYNLLNDALAASRSQDRHTVSTEAAAAVLIVGNYLDSDLAKSIFPNGIQKDQITAEDLQPLSDILIPKIKECQSVRK